MPTIKCQYPVRIDKAAHERLRQAGFVFTKLSKGKVGPFESHGFTELQYVAGTAEQLVERLAGLHYSDIARIYSNVHASEVGKAIKQAENTITLRRLAQLPNDGFPFGVTNTRPATWDLHFKIPAELAALEEKLKPFGITQIRVGQEIEFGLEKDPVPGNNHWKTVRDKALADLEHRARHAPPEERSKLEAKAQKLATFNAREILMYDIIELDPRTKNIVEYLFGNTTNDDTSYYDQANCLELKLKHVPVQEYIRNHQMLLRVLVEKVSQYGTIFFQVLNHNQINLSFWDEKGNLQDATHPDFSTKGAAIAAGVTKAVSEALPVFRSDYKMDKDDAQPITLQTNRDGILRSSRGRIELRPETHSGGEQHPEMMVTVAVAGALHGLKALSGAITDPGLKPATTAVNPVVEVPSNQFKMFSHVLASCQVLQDGSLVPAKFYTQERAIHMAYEFGISPTDPDTVPPMMMILPRYAPFLVDFVKSMRIVKKGDGFELVIPETEPGKYAFTVPEINLDKIPRRVAKKIRAGVDPQSIRDEWKDYITGGDWAPWAAEPFEIDTNKIKQAIKITALEGRQVVMDGYDVNASGTFTDARQYKPQLFARVEDTKASAILAGGLSDEFRGQLGQCLDTAIKPPLTTDKVSKERITELMAWIQLGFEDFKDLRSWNDVVMQRVHIPDIPSQGYEAMNDLSTEFMAVFNQLWGPKVAQAIFAKRHMFLSNNSDRGIDMMADRTMVEILLPQIKLPPEELEIYRKKRTSTIQQEMQEVAAEQTRRPDKAKPVRQAGPVVRKEPAKQRRRGLQ